MRNLYFILRTQNATISFSIAYTHNPPSYPSTTYSVPIYQNSTSFSIDLQSLVSDIEENSYLNATFSSTSIARGKWVLNNASTNFDFQVLQMYVGSSYILNLTVDGYGAATSSYFSFVMTAKDSTGYLNASLTGVTVSGQALCPTGTFVNPITSQGLCLYPNVSSHVFTLSENDPATLYTLSTSPISTDYPLTLFVATFPQNGTLYRYSRGLQGPEITISNTQMDSNLSDNNPISSNHLFYYKPNNLFYGQDSFTYFGQNSVLTSSVTINFTVGFVNQAPIGHDTTIDITQGGASTYTIDLLALVTDPDEFHGFTFFFETLPIRGRWDDKSFSSIYVSKAMNNGSIGFSVFDTGGG